MEIKAGMTFEYESEYWMVIEDESMDEDIKAARIEDMDDGCDLDETMYFGKDEVKKFLEEKKIDFPGAQYKNTFEDYEGKWEITDIEKIGDLLFKIECIAPNSFHDPDDVHYVHPDGEITYIDVDYAKYFIANIRPLGIDIGDTYEDPDGEWEITGIDYENQEVSIECIQEGNVWFGMEGNVPISEAYYYVCGYDKE